jgi:hypothetical protein
MTIVCALEKKYKKNKQFINIYLVISLAIIIKKLIPQTIFIFY